MNPLEVTPVALLELDQPAVPAPVLGSTGPTSLFQRLVLAEPNGHKERRIHAAAEHSGDHGVGIADEFEAKLVDRWLAEHKAIEGTQNHLVARVPPFQPVGPAAHELLPPVRPVDEAFFVVSIHRFEDVPWVMFQV